MRLSDAMAQHAIPVETLVDIFRAAISARSDDCDPDRKSMEANETKLRQLPPPFVLSHVCRHWRTVAIGARTLWTRIDFNEPSPFHLSKTSIERSGKLPLDITFDHATVRPISVTAMTCDEGRQAYYHMSPDARKGKHIAEALEVALHYIERWRCFSLCTADLRTISASLYRLSKVTSAPMLKTIRILKPDERYIKTAISRYPTLLFSGCTPRLTHIEISGVSISWDLLHSNVEKKGPSWPGLTTLDLSFLYRNNRPSFSSFAKMLRASPHLISLGLTFAGPSGDVDEFGTRSGMGDWPARGDPPIPLHSLETLRLSADTVGYAAALLGTLHITSLRRLCVDVQPPKTWGMFDRDAFVDALCDPICVLANLEELELNGLGGHQYQLEDLFKSTPRLHTLSVDQRTVSHHILAPLRWDDATHVCPALHTFAIRGPRVWINESNVVWNSFVEFVKSRARSGHRLRHVTVTHVRSALEQLGWLRDEVEELKFVGVAPEPRWNDFDF